jgi:hypothetical protein
MVRELVYSDYVLLGYFKSFVIYFVIRKSVDLHGFLAFKVGNFCSHGQRLTIGKIAFYYCT